MEHMIAVIPVRAGSERVKNKNFRKFAGSSLLQIKIDQLKKIPSLEIIVNTDSELAIDIAKKNGVRYHRREKYYASSKCTGSEYFTHLAKVTESKNILIAPVTSPLIKIETIEECINIFFENDCDSLMTVKDVKEFLWENNKPINYDLSSAPNSQDLPDIFSPTFGVIISNRDSMLRSKNFICSKPYFHKVSNIEAVDIDTELDFKFAEYLYTRQANSLSSYKSVVANEESKNIAIDFDGVIHSNSKGFHDGTVYDKPIAGAVEAIQKLSKRYNIIIFSAKAKPDRPLVEGKTGTELIWEWLDKYNLSECVSLVTSEKPRSIAYIDDKAIRFKNWEKAIQDINELYGDGK